MIYELREYVAAPGRADDLHARFRDHTFDLFTKHAIDLVGYWTVEADPGRIVYLARFADADAKKDAWAAFQADPDWQRVKAESEADGAIVAEMSSRTLASPEFWTAVTAAIDTAEERSA